MPRAIAEIYKEIEKKHDCMSILHGQLYCTACNKTIRADRGHIRIRIREHICSAAHTANEKERKKSGSTLPIALCLQKASATQEDEKEFYLDLVRAYLATETFMASATQS